MVETSPDPKNGVTDEHYRLIGMIATEWAFFEHLLNRAFLITMQMDPARITCLTGQMIGATPRLKAIQAIAELEEWSDGLKNKIRSFSQKTFELAEKRNRAV